MKAMFGFVNEFWVQETANGSGSKLIQYLTKKKYFLFSIRDTIKIIQKDKKVISMEEERTMGIWDLTQWRL